MKKKKSKVSIFQNIITYTLIIIVFTIGYSIFFTDFLSPSLNEMTASYISFNNNSTTDMIKVNNLKRMSDKKGISNKNKSKESFSVTGRLESTYQIVLYHLGSNLDEKYVKYQLENEKNKIFSGILSNNEVTPDGGFIIYEGTLKEGKRWTLKMWASKEYKNSVDNVSYEIRIKTK